MKTIKDINTSSLGFGCWAVGGTWNNINDKDSIDAIRAAVDYGIHFFDVAPVYGLGHAEKVLGRALEGVDRSKVVIATKCGLVWDNNKHVKNDLSAGSIFREVDESLARLNTDHIDLYQVHWPDPNTPISETAQALAELKQQGKIRHVGVSNYSLDMTREMMEGVEVATFQGLYNLIEQNPSSYHGIPLDYRARDEVIPFCADNDIKYLPYSPLMQGLLTGKLLRTNNWDQNDDRHNNPKLNGEAFEKYYNCVEELKVLAHSAHVPLSYIAIQWLTNQHEVGPVIAGAHTIEQVRENALSLNKMLSNEVLLRAEEIVRKWGVE